MQSESRPVGSGEFDSDEVEIETLSYRAMLTQTYDHITKKMSLVDYDRLKHVSAHSFSLVTSRGRRFELEAKDLLSAISWSPGEPLEIEKVDRSKSWFIIRRVAVIPCQEIRARETP
jgi:hypothetical protein